MRCARGAWGERYPELIYFSSLCGICAFNAKLPLSDAEGARHKSCADQPPRILHISQNTFFALMAGVAPCLLGACPNHFNSRRVFPRTRSGRVPIRERGLGVSMFSPEASVCPQAVEGIGKRSLRMHRDVWDLQNVISSQRCMNLDFATLPAVSLRTHCFGRLRCRRCVFEVSCLAGAHIRLVECHFPWPCCKIGCLWWARSKSVEIIPALLSRVDVRHARKRVKVGIPGRRNSLSIPCDDRRTLLYSPKRGFRGSNSMTRSCDPRVAVCLWGCLGEAFDHGDFFGRCLGELPQEDVFWGKLWGCVAPGCLLQGQLWMSLRCPG